MLAEDQVKAVKDIKSWWSSSKAFHILDGGAGVGKTFIVDKILSELPRVKPILLAPTHKALNQLKAKVSGDYEFKTVASSLGIRPVDEGLDLKFEHHQLPNFWERVNLAVTDEASMLDTYHLDLFKTIGVKILYIGHKSQLPPVRKSRTISDKCISPVFTQGYAESHLWIPKRNTGRLWEVNDILEQKIYNDRIPFPLDYDIGRNALTAHMGNKDTIDSICAGSTKIALWTNDAVNKYNHRIRELIFGKRSITKFLPTDLVVIKNSVISFPGMEFMNDKSIIKFTTTGIDIYTDTDGRVIDSTEVLIMLNKTLRIQCYKLTIATEVHGNITIYSLLHKDDFKRIADYYEHIAWSFSSKAAKDKAYRERSLILKCFAKVKHFYAATSHSLQGSSIENVVAILSDINKNSNRIERNKCAYVACSRASKTLITYRGL